MTAVLSFQSHYDLSVLLSCISLAHAGRHKDGDWIKINSQEPEFINNGAINVSRHRSNQSPSRSVSDTYITMRMS